MVRIFVINRLSYAGTKHHRKLEIDGKCEKWVIFAISKFNHCFPCWSCIDYMFTNFFLVLQFKQNSFYYLQNYQWTTNFNLLQLIKKLRQMWIVDRINLGFFCWSSLNCFKACDWPCAANLKRSLDNSSTKSTPLRSVWGGTRQWGDHQSSLTYLACVNIKIHNTNVTQLVSQEQSLRN